MKIQDVVDQITTLKAQLLRFGVQAVTSVSRPAAPGLGQVVYEGDTGNLSVYTGTAWRKADSAMLNVTAATRPSAPLQGQMIWQTDTLTAFVWNGTTWKQFTLT